MNKFDMGKRAKAEKDTAKKSVFDWSKAKKEVSFFKPVEGEINRFDIVPYIIKTKQHPLVASGDLAVGDPDYSLEYWVHKNIGPQNKLVLCPNRMYGQPCPICDAGKAFKDEGDDKAAKACWPSLRVAYNVKTKDGKIQIFDVSNHLFGKAFKAVQAAENEDGAAFLAADIENGKTVVFKAVHVKKDGMEFTEFEGLNLKDRKTPVTEDNVESTISFDECLIHLTADKIDAIFHGGEDSDEESEEAENEEKSKEEVVEKKTSTVKEKSHSDDDEDDKPKCHHGHTYGKDNDEYRECKDCKEWKPCYKAQ
jgi:hypothetical protein